MKKMGFVLELRADKIDEYKKLHVAVWPEILQSLSDASIGNYQIFLREPENLLVSYWEFHGEDFSADMQNIADLDITKKWWELCIPCQRPLATAKEGQWWAEMEQVFNHP